MKQLQKLVAAEITARGGFSGNALASSCYRRHYRFSLPRLMLRTKVAFDALVPKLLYLPFYWRSQ